MAGAYLNEIEATKAWVLRACEWKTRRIAARFDVDPRRLYEVWEEIDHKGSRFRAMQIFGRLLPAIPISRRFEVHKPRYQRVIRQPEQPMLPGF